MTYSHDDDSRARGHEAHHTSQTRFGPRPVPRPGLEPGTTQRDGDSMTSQILVYGGLGIMAAAATTAAVLATRKVASAIAGSDEEPVARTNYRPTSGGAPRFADLDPDAQEAVRRRGRAQAAADRARAAQSRATASRGRDLASNVTGTARDLTDSLNGVIASLSGAVAGFRSVAEQAGGIVREFSDAADVVRNVMGQTAASKPSPRARAPKESAEGELRADRMHRL